MTAEHAMLDKLLAKAEGLDGAIDADAYDRFRRALLRHIKIEEKVLLPMAECRRGSETLPVASRLRLDHGALAAVLMLPPAASTFRAIRAVLDAHNPLEEDPDGAYDQCDRLAGAEIDELIAQCTSMPPVAASPWIDSPKVLAAAKRVLVRAGYDAGLLDPANGG
jgi:hypothetical protein